MNKSIRVERLALTMSNAWLIHAPEGLVLVDTGLPRDARMILARIEACPAQRLCQIFITHAHLDHCGGAAEIRAHTRAPVLIHEADAHDLATGETHLGEVRDWRWSRSILPAIERRLLVPGVVADHVVHDGETLEVGGLAVTILHIPGHSPGSSALLVRTGEEAGESSLLAFSGDLVVIKGRPRVQGSYAVNWTEVATSLSRLKAARPDVIYAGHGPRSIAGEELASLPLTGAALRRSQSRVYISE